jgi:tetratricopeptide (TPR) repeat protein
MMLSALTTYPASADIALLRAEWLTSLGRVADARAAFQEVLGLDPSSLDALHGEAELARTQRNYATAERLLQQLLMRAPHFVPALESYALLERSRENRIQAAEWQTKRVAADPSPPSKALVLLARMLFEAGQANGAERLANEVLVRDRSNADAHRILGETRWRQSRWEDAAPHFESIIHYHPAWTPRIYELLANVYRNLDRAHDAEAITRKAERIFPRSGSLADAAARYEDLQLLTDTTMSASQRPD